MKQLFLLTGALVTSIFSMAQWSGTNPVTTTSKVGIGVTSPSENLEVYGNIKINSLNQSGPYHSKYTGKFIMNNGYLESYTLSAPGTGVSKITLSTPGGSLIGSVGSANPGTLSLGANHTLNLSASNKIVLTGNVGIGTSSPQQKLDVNGNIRISAIDGKGLVWGNGTFGVLFKSDNSMLFKTGNQERMRIYNGGKGTVLIGSESSLNAIGTQWKNTYKLAVDGKAICEDLTVKMSTNWADYVFEEDYELMGLEETKDFILTNKHLPNVPSANEVESNGITTSEMFRIQMEKIEELTLHLIQLSEENTLLQEKVDALSKQ